MLFQCRGLFRRWCPAKTLSVERKHECTLYYLNNFLWKCWKAAVISSLNRQIIHWTGPVASIFQRYFQSPEGFCLNSLPGDVLHQKMHKNRGCPNWRRDKNLSDPILPGQGKSPTMIPLFQVCLRRTPHGTTVDGVMISQQAGKAWLGFVPSHESKLKTWKSVAFLLSEPFRSQRFGGFHTCDVQCTLTWTYDTWKQGQQANSRQTSAAASSTLWLFNIAVEAMAHL